VQTKPKEKCKETKSVGSAIPRGSTVLGEVSGFIHCKGKTEANSNVEG